MHPSANVLTGRDVILEIVRNLCEGSEPLLYSTIAPSVFHVYLHPDDYERLHPIFARLTEEAIAALDQEVARLNRRIRLRAALARITGAPTPVQRSGEGWHIDYQADPDDAVEPGAIAVVSELALPPPPDFAGPGTRRIVTTRTGHPTATRQDVAPPEGAPAAGTLATLRYKDERGDHLFRITKDLIKVGRGGVSYWVDVQLHTSADVSREHFRLRRDPASGTFFIADLSAFGTTVNGKRLPSSVEVVDGQKREKQPPVENPLPPRATIGVADTVSIEFEAGENG
jgi:FHA domain-containing protein